MVIVTIDLPSSTASDFSTLLSNFILLGRILEAMRNSAETRMLRMTRS
jgi:hypothetical protein